MNLNKVVLLFTIALFVGSSIGCSPNSNNAKEEENTDTIKVGTYNIRADSKNDAEKDKWEKRNVILENLLKEYDYDVFGFQEPYLNQMEDMLQYLSKDYEYVGTTVSGNSRAERGHFNTIFYKKDRFDVGRTDQGIFWLSETPNTPNSKGWDAYSSRMCVWALIKDQETGKEFYHFNLHFDHKGVQARVESANLVVSKIKEIAGDKPVLLTGDFNADQNSEAYRIITSSDILEDSYHLTDAKENADWPTYNGFKFITEPQPNARRIDHVFVEGGTVESWKLVNDSYNEKYPSDHFPIIIEWLPE